MLIRIASGDHPICLGQAARVERALRALPESPEVVAVTVESARDPALQIERLAWRLHQGQADAAVCIAACLAVGLPQGIEVGAVLRGSDPRYFFVSLGKGALRELEEDAKVVTWDAVCRAQVLHGYPYLNVEPVRSWAGLHEGLRHGEWAAACLPPEVVQAGSTWGLRTEEIDVEEVMPAIGQGDLALLIPEGERHPLVTSVNQDDTMARLRLESAFWWQALEACNTVATARVVLSNGAVELTGIIADADGAWLVRDTARGPELSDEAIAQELAESCKAMASKHLARQGGSDRAAS